MAIRDTAVCFGMLRYDRTKVKQAEPYVNTSTTSKVRVNKIEEEQKVDVLIALVESEAVDLLVSLCTPNDITTKSYEDLTAMLTRHYGCGENEVISSYKFDTRDQAETETISEYIVALKKLSTIVHLGMRINSRMQTLMADVPIQSLLILENCT